MHSCVMSGQQEISCTMCLLSSTPAAEVILPTHKLFYITEILTSFLPFNFKSLTKGMLTS